MALGGRSRAVDQRASEVISLCERIPDQYAFSAKSLKSRNRRPDKLSRLYDDVYKAADNRATIDEVVRTMRPAGLMALTPSVVVRIRAEQWAGYPLTRIVCPFWAA